MSSTDAAGVKKRQRGRKNNSAGAGGSGKAKAPAAAARTPIDPNASDESLLVESPQQFALRMRKLLATLFREQAQATGDRYPLAAPKLGTSQSFSSEQIWGQLSVLYAPVLKKASKSVSRLRVSEEEEEEADAPSAAPAAKKKGSKKATFADEEYADEDDASMSGGFSDSAASVALSSDAEVDKLESRLRRRNRGGKRGGKGVDPDAWRYALGKPSELEDEDLSEDDDAIGDDDMAPKHKRGRDEAAELDAGDDDDLEGLEDDFEGESDMAGDGDEEEELGDDASEADSAAALRELYGSDAEAGDDDDDDEEREDDDDDDPMNEENFDEFMDDRSSQGVADEEDDDDGAAAAASPFGPAAAPENPLDFTDIDNNKKLTAFEKDEQKRLRVARDLEMSRVHGADWAMKGEVAAGARPRDSLIDTTLDFEHALPPAPVITEYFTGKLEDRIKRRVADNNFDDVERKVMQTAPEDLQSTKRDEALDAQKSKLSLMDLYEKEFLEKQAAAERAEGGPAMAEALTEIERDELKAVQMWKRLSQHLDALSNFYFTPKPVNPEVEARVRAVQNQAPAITLEPVGMNAVAKEDVLAPQDVFRPKRGIHTDAAGSELTSDERKAIRRAAKANTKAAEGRKEKQHAANDKKKTAAKKASGGDAAGKKS